MKKLVSIVIPVYNIADYVSYCINSVLNQSYKNIEIILVDDGSSDGSGVVCDKFWEEYGNIKVIHKKNGGLSSARNAGIDIATGEYIMFIDGDDYISKNAVEYLMYIEELTNADIVQFGYIETEQVNENISVKTSREYELISDRRNFFDKLYEIGGEAASSCTKLYKKGVFDDLRFREGILHEDEYIVPSLFEKAQSIAYIPEKLYFYIMRNESIIKSRFTPKKLDIFIYQDDRIKILKKLQYYDILEKEYQRQVSTAIHLFYDAQWAGYRKEAERILNRLKYYTTLDILIYNKFDRIIYKLCKINIKFMYLFYTIDRIRHKEKYNGTNVEKNN